MSLSWLIKVFSLVFFTGVCTGQNRVDGTFSIEQPLSPEETEVDFESRSNGVVKSFVEAKSFLRTYLGDHGLEVYPFKVGWYNEYIDMINKDFHKFSYPEDTIGFITLYTPEFFGRVLKPFVRDFARTHGVDALGDWPMVEFTKHLLSEIEQGLSPLRMEYYSADERVNETDKYFGVQAAGDVSGGVRYYHKEDVVPPYWPQNTTIHSVSIHPRYGGWFAFLGAVILPELQYPGLLRVAPEDVVPSREFRIELLEKANINDVSWKDTIVDKRYSEEQLLFDYRATKEERIAMMRSWVEQ